jgi:trafficking protein particle complex subunit 5
MQLGLWDNCCWYHGKSVSQSAGSNIQEKMAAAGGGGSRSILDRPLVLRPRGEVSLSAFAFLFSEMVQYTQERSQSVDDMQVFITIRIYKVAM